MKLNKMVDTEDDVYDFNSLIEEYLDKRIEYRPESNNRLFTEAHP